jgi:NADH-quinone oxidoreductase subunit E
LKKLLAASEPAPVSKAKPAKVEAAERFLKKHQTLKQARDGKPDDLKKLKGVGPKLEATLHELGFFHFDQVASWGRKRSPGSTAELKFKGRIERDDWIEQAKDALRRRRTEFSKRVEAAKSFLQEEDKEMLQDKDRIFTNLYGLHDGG